MTVTDSHVTDVDKTLQGLFVSRDLRVLVAAHVSRADVSDVSKFDVITTVDEVAVFLSAGVFSLHLKNPSIFIDIKNVTTQKCVKHVTAQTFI